MAQRLESGRAVVLKGKGKRKRVVAVVKPSATSSTGRNAAAAHGYTQKKAAPVVRVKATPRTPLRVAYRQDVREEGRKGSAAQRGASFRKSAQRTADIDATEKRTRSKYDSRTRNFVRKGAVIDPRTGKLSTDVEAATRQAGLKHAEAGSTAVALKIMDQTTRLSKGVSAGARTAIRGGSPFEILKSQVGGVAKNKGPGFGRILHEDLGVSKGLAAPGGFVADVLTDPLTYVSGGTGKVSRLAAEKAARDAVKAAGKAGMSEAGVALVARQAARKAAVGKSASKGVVVKFAGKEVPGVRRATAKAGEGVARATPERVKSSGRAVLRQVNPALAKPGVDADTHYAVRQALGRTRARRANLATNALHDAAVADRRIKSSDAEEVIAAIEGKRIGSLPEHLQEAARSLETQFKGDLRLRRRAGVPTGDVTKFRPQGAMSESAIRKQREAARGYFPHMRKEDIDPEGAAPEGKRLKRTGTVTPSSGRKRQDLRPIGVQNPERAVAGESPFSTNIPLVRANYGAQTAGAVAKGELFQDLKKVGRPAKAPRVVNGREIPGSKFDRETEGVYFFPSPSKTGGNAPVKVDPSEIPFGRPGFQEGAVRKNGQYVILNNRAVEDALGSVEAGRTEVGAFFDKAQGKWKTVATATPGFQIRNLIGDNTMALLAQGRKLPKNLGTGYGAARRVSQREKAREEGRHLARSTKTIKVNGKEENLDDFVDAAMREGIGRGGQRGHEIASYREGEGAVEAAKGFKGKRRGVRRRVTQSAGWRAAGRAFRNREDMTRLATYKWARDQGLGEADAAMAAKAVHIDYGEVTDAERTVFRRAAPFYTFSARALPFHVKAVMKHPGRVAGIEKARQELNFAFEGDDSQLPEYKQRAIPFRVGSKALDAALPINLLNEVPNPKNLKGYPAEAFQFAGGMLTPFAKVPIELGLNRSLFFRRDIQSEDFPRVSAPDWVKLLPQPAKDALGVRPIVDRRSGETVTGWYGKSQYLASTVPGLPVLLQQLTTEGSLRSGRSGTDKWLSATGVKVDPVDPLATRLYNLLDESAKIGKQINSQKQVPGGGGGKGSQSAKTRELYARQDKVNEELYRLSTERGDKNPYKEGVLSKKAKRRALGGGGGVAGGVPSSEISKALGPSVSGAKISSDELKKALGR